MTRNSIWLVRWLAFALAWAVAQPAFQSAQAATSATLIAQFHFEDNAKYSGTPGEVADSAGYTGGPFNGTAIGSTMPTMQPTNAARAGDPGTCLNVSLPNNPAIDVAGLPVLTTVGAATSVSFWMYWDGTNGVMPLGWAIYDLWLNGGAFGFNTGAFDIYGISSTGLANGWHHVAAVFYNGSVTGNQLYLDGTIQTLSQRLGTPSTSAAVVQSTLRIGGWTNNTGYRFSGRLDELKVFNGALTAAQVTSLYTETHACGPVAEWRLDEMSWSATAGEVLNSSDSSTGGTAKFNATYGSTLPSTKAGGKVCGQGDFSGSGDFVDVANATVDSMAGNLTVMGWINVNDLSSYQYVYSNAKDNAGPTHGMQLAGRYAGSAPQFDLWFSDGSHATVAGGTALAVGTWAHLVGTWDGTTLNLYVNGSLVASDSSFAGKSYVGSSTYPGTLGAMAYNQGAYGANAFLDEVKVWNRALTGSEVASVYGYENMGKRWNGTTPVCPAPAALLAQYHFEESTAWNGTTGEVKDTAGANGGPYNGTLAGSPAATQLTTSPALAGTPGTCAYAKLPGSISNGGRVELRNLPVSTKAGDQTSVAFWMYWDGTNGVMPIGWNLYDLWMAGSVMGFNTGASDAYGVSNTGLANGWHHVVAVFYNGSVFNNLIYIDGVLQAMPLTKTSPNLANAYVQSTLNVGGISSNAYYRFSGFVDEVQVYSGTLYPAQVKAIMAQTHPCMPINVPGYLNAFDTNTAQGAITGSIKTKVAGTAYTVDVVALNASKTAVDTSYKQVVKVEVLANGAAGTSLDSSNCPVTYTVLQTTTATLASGRVTVPLPSEPNVWRDARIRLSYPATGTPSLVACSTDNYAIRPASLSVLAQDADWQTGGFARTLNATTAAATPVHKAGQPFGLVVTGYNSLGTLTSNYNGAPIAASVTCSLPVSGCVTGTFAQGTFSGSGGTVNSTGATYSEVGVISLQLQDASFASVDTSDGSLTADLTAYSNAISVGRFVPDHFSVIPGTVTQGCAISGKTAYTYLGQDSLSTQQTLFAQNALNATTQNYTGTLAKLILSNYANYGFTALGMPTGSSLGSGAQAPVGTWLAGVATNTQANHVVSKPASVMAPVTVSILAAPLDSDGVTVAAPVTVASNQLYRFGRLKLGNAYGATSTDLVLPVTAQYWSGSSYVTNNDDGCTSFSSSALGFRSYTADLSTAEMGTAHLLGSSWTVIQGASTIRLSRPSGGDGKYRGSTDLFINLGSDSACTTATTSSMPLAYLQDNWPWMGAHCANPIGRATFGVEKQKFMFRREVF